MQISGLRHSTTRRYDGRRHQQPPTHTYTTQGRHLALTGMGRGYCAPARTFLKQLQLRLQQILQLPRRCLAVSTLHACNHPACQGSSRRWQSNDDDVVTEELPPSKWMHSALTLPLHSSRRTGGAGSSNGGGTNAPSPGNNLRAHTCAAQHQCAAGGRQAGRPAPCGTAAGQQGAESASSWHQLLCTTQLCGA